MVFECERGPWATAMDVDLHSVDELLAIYEGPDAGGDPAPSAAPKDIPGTG